jgi:hypothetical protein
VGRYPFRGISGGQYLPYDGCHAVQIILWVLESKARRQRGAVGQGTIHHPVGVGGCGLGYGSPVPCVHQQGANREGAEIQTEGIEGLCRHMQAPFAGSVLIIPRFTGSVKGKKKDASPE